MLEKFRQIYDKHREVILYIFFGCLTTVANYVPYVIMTELLHANEFLSVAVAWIISVLFAYFTNRKWVFRSTASGTKEIAFEMVSFFAARAFSLVVDMACMYVGKTLLGLNHLLVKLFANVLVIILNYVFSKLIIFRKKPKKDETKHE